MTIETPKGRTAWPLAALMLAAATLGGCASGPAFLGGTSRKVTFSNVTSTPLNVTFFVKSTPMPKTDGQATPAQSTDDPVFVPEKTFQLDRGEMSKFTVAHRSTNGRSDNSSVHVRIEPVSPSWQPSARTYWLELLTNPPVSIVATGTADDLTFDTGEGAVAVIPQSEIESGRFAHHVAGVTQDSE